METDDTRNEAGKAAANEAQVDPRLLEILVCPVTRGPLSYDRARGELVSAQARLAYPIRDGIPIMLAEEARSLDRDDIGPNRGGFRPDV